MLVKSFVELMWGREDGVVFATQADEGDGANGSPLPGLDEVWMTEGNKVVLGFKAGDDPSYGYTTLNRQKCMELALFLAKCASCMEDE